MASTQMEYLKSIMAEMMKKGGMPKFDGDINPAVLRETIEAAQKGMPLEPGVIFEQDSISGIEVEKCVPQSPRPDALIFYIHGGGLICGNAFTSRGYGSMLAKETAIPVYTVTYRLAPENPYPAAINDCFAVYTELARRYSDVPIFLIGESGGAYLSIITTMKARDNEIKMPAGVILYSPVTDFSGSLERTENGDITVTLAGFQSLRKMYAPDEAVVKEPYCSPILCDFRYLPPMLLAWDASETLAADSEALAAKLKEANVPVYYKSYPGCFHAFATTGKGTPESAEVLADTVQFIASRQ